MRKRPLPSPDELRKMLRYDPDTGKLFWLRRGPESFGNGGDGLANYWNNKFCGKEALTADCGHGYKKGAVKGKNYYAHRVALAIHNGEWPNGEVDHINMNKSDNRLVNLRIVTRAQNSANKPKMVGKSSSFKGVCWVKKRRVWLAQINYNHKHYHLGHFKTEEDAAEAYKKAAIKFYGDHSIFRDKSQ